MRLRILAGNLKPGERIVESRLAKELGVGQPTIREALVALESVGLVTRVAPAQALKATAMGGNRDDFLRLDLELHRLAWRLSGNDFLPRHLEQ